MFNDSTIHILHKLATKAVFPSEFDSPNKYLKWFLEVISDVFRTDDKLVFANIHYFNFKIGDNENFKDGRLLNIPTLYRLTSQHKLNSLQSEVITFLVAVNISEQMNSYGIRSSINAFEDKLIIETITNNTDITNNPLVSYNKNQKIISIYLPVLYDSKISGIFSEYISNKTNSVTLKLNESLAIENGGAVDSALNDIFLKEKFKKIVPSIVQFLQSNNIIKFSNDYQEVIHRLNLPMEFTKHKTALHNFINTALLHAWIKNVRYNYQIILTHYDENKNPISYATFLVVTDKRLTYDKINLLHISLNIALSALTEIAQWAYKRDLIGFEDNKKNNIVNSAFDNKDENHKSSLIYKSSVMEKLDFEITKSARTNEHILLLGETGVGKDLIASEIHNRSNRAGKPFITLPINNLSESLIESELFGHSKGSFTGASEERAGRFESANGGTIYLPEISELPEKIQLKLLEFFQYKNLDKVGNKGEKVHLDVRLIFASNADLYKQMKQGKLREDFYYRINVISFIIPPLRDRKEDIAILTEHFIKKHSIRIRGEQTKYDKADFDRLLNQEWKGNVRELEHLVISALVKADDNVLSKDLFLRLLSTTNTHQSFIQNTHEAKDFKSQELEFKRNYFISLLKQTNGKISEAAKLAGISRQALYNICKELDISI